MHESLEDFKPYILKWPQTNIREEKNPIVPLIYEKRKNPDEETAPKEYVLFSKHTERTEKTHHDHKLTRVKHPRPLSPFMVPDLKSYPAVKSPIERRRGKGGLRIQMTSREKPHSIKPYTKYKI